MLSEGQVGIQILNDGSTQPFRMTKLAAMVVQELHGRYYEQTYRGNTFLASTQASGIFTLLATTAYTGLILVNPPGSGKNLVLLDVCIAQSTAATGITTFVLAANTNIIQALPTSTTAVTIRPTLLGSGAATVAAAYSIATLATAPVVIRAIGGGPVATGTQQVPFIRDEVAGSIILAPGTTVNIATLTTTMSAVASFTWEEVTI